MLAAMKSQASIVGLRRVGFLIDLSDARLEALAKQFNWRRVSEGDAVVTRAARDRDVYLIVGGKVRVAAASAAGRQVTYHDLGPGSLIGELAALDGGARSADVLALEDTLVAAMPPALFNQILDESRTANRWMMQRLSASVRELTERVFDLTTLGVQNRVHAELLRLAREAGVADNRASINPAPRHVDVATRISTNREQVAREMSELAKRGLVERAGRALLVCNVGGLESLVAEVRC